MRQELVLRIHTQAEFHAAGIIQLVHILEEEVAALCLFQQQRLNLIQLIVVVGRGADSYELYAEAFVVQTLGVQLYRNGELVTYVQVG